MFFRLALLLLFSFSFVYGGCRYNSCEQKIFDSNLNTKTTLRIAVQKGVDLVYSTKPVTKNILKYDPFLSLYLVKHKYNFPYPFYINLADKKRLAIVDAYNTYEGVLVQKQVGLNTLAQFSKKVDAPKILSNTCCALEGIVTPQGIIQKEYLYRFIHTKKVQYGDVGIRVEQTKEGIKVVASNPYSDKNLFKVDDIVIKMDQKKLYDASELMQKILFSPLGSHHTFEILRHHKKLTINAITSRRYGGGAISDTFLEQQGIYFDDKLIIIQLDTTKQTYGLEVGDKLVQINRQNVKTQQDLRRVLSHIEEFSSLLISRNGFEFFVNIKKGGI